MQTLLDALAEYITVLSDSLCKTARAEDRLRYIEHLAEAAVLFSLVHRGASRPVLQEKIHQEQKSFGAGYLSGPEGEAAETAFGALVAILIHLPFPDKDSSAFG